MGYLSASKKSAVRRCPSRCPLPVSIDEASTVVVTLESVSSGAVTITPPKVAKRPRTLLTIMWRTVKETSECTGSMSHVPAT